MSQAKISPRRGVQYKRIGKVSIPLLALLASFFVVSMPKPTYAELDCPGEESGVTIDDGEVTINSSSIDPNTISFELDNDEEHATLTLTNYNGGSICIYDGYYDIILKLEGENNITDSLASRGSIIIEGDGALNMGQLEVYNLFVKSGSIEPSYTIVSQLRILGGKVSTKLAYADKAFYQQAGELNIESSNDPFCLYSDFVVFNGGAADIECTGAPAIISRSGLGGRYDEIVGEQTAETDGNIMHVSEYSKGDYNDYYKPLHGSILFNDGDISLKSDIVAIVFQLGEDKGYPFDPNIGAYLDQKGKDYFIMIADGMLVNGAEPVVDAFVNSDENVIYSTLTDGTSGAMISISGDLNEGEATISASPNILKAVRISKNGTPVPDADDDEEEDTEEDEETEENPNTIDAKIIGIALGTLFAIIAEGVIIGDLYRRLFSYEKEIANIDEKSDYTSEDTPDKT